MLFVLSFLCKEQGCFEIRIADYFVSKNLSQWREKGIAQSPAYEFIIDNVFDMEMCLKKFKKHYAEIYTEKDLKFLEHDGPIIASCVPSLRDPDESIKQA